MCVYGVCVCACRSKGRRLQVLGQVSAVCPLLEIAGKTFFCLHLQEEEHTLPVLVTVREKERECV